MSTASDREQWQCVEVHTTRGEYVTDARVCRRAARRLCPARHTVDAEGDRVRIADPEIDGGVHHEWVGQGEAGISMVRRSMPCPAARNDAYRDARRARVRLRRICVEAFHA